MVTPEAPIRSAAGQTRLKSEDWFAELEAKSVFLLWRRILLNSRVNGATPRCHLVVRKA
jgi:hypothetical protein